MTINEALEQRFLEFAARNDVKKADEIWRLIKSSYTESHRAYHKLEHLSAMFADLDDYSIHHKQEGNGFDIEYRDELEAAIWFHDIIMVTRDARGNTPNDNEEKSARLAEDLLWGGLLDVGVISKLIRLTHYSKSNHPQTLEEELILDIDLAILGKPREVFDRYEKGIRFEYSHVPAELFCRVRAGVLESFAKIEPLYRNEFFREKYEQAAKRNLSYSAEKLKQGICGDEVSTGKGR